MKICNKTTGANCAGDLRVKINGIVEFFSSEMVVMWRLKGRGFRFSCMSYWLVGNGVMELK